ncbi:MAG: hypothetical protein ACK56F_16950, partial [bacterium]
MGHEGVGKTILAYRIKGDIEEAKKWLQYDRDGKRAKGLPDDEGATRGIHHEKFDLHGLTVRLWDYAGQHVYRHTHMCFFSSQTLYLLVFDLSDSDETKAIRELGD